MSGCWVRFRMYNLELDGDITLAQLRLRPLPDHKDLCRRISAKKLDLAPFLYTADAIVQVGDGAEAPEVLVAQGWKRLQPVHASLRFLQQRDFRVADWFLHTTPDCDDESTQCGERTGIFSVPYQPKIQVAGPQQRLLEDAARTWSDDQLESKTSFQQAVNWQHAAMGREVPIETQYSQQWLALETLFQRWSASCPDAPQDRKVDEWVVAHRVRPAFQDALASLVANGDISDEEAEALVDDVKPDIYVAAEIKARAFLRSHGVTDLDRKPFKGWAQDCAEIRNKLLHGRSLAEAYEKRPEKEDPAGDLNVRIMRLRNLVNRYVMSVIGYEPDGWDFASCCGGRYVKRDAP